MDSQRISPLTRRMPSSETSHIRHVVIEHGANIEADGRAAMDFAVRLGNSAAGDLLAKHSASYTVREAVAFNRLATNWGYAHLGGIVGNEGCARCEVLSFDLGYRERTLKKNLTRETRQLIPVKKVRYSL